MIFFSQNLCIYQLKYCRRVPCIYAIKLSGINIAQRSNLRSTKYPIMSSFNNAAVISPSSVVVSTYLFYPPPHTHINKCISVYIPALSPLPHTYTH